MHSPSQARDEGSRETGSAIKKLLDRLTAIPSSWRGLTLAISLVAATAVGGVSLSAGVSAASMTTAARSSAPSPKAVALDDTMRALWEAHGTWTERAIVDFVGGLPDTPVVIAQLLANQTDIGNAIKPYYGNAASSALATLLRSHINDAVAVLKAAR